MNERPTKKNKRPKNDLKTQKVESGTKERGIREIGDGNSSLSFLPIFPNFLQINPLPSTSPSNFQQYLQPWCQPGPKDHFTVEEELKECDIACYILHIRQKESEFSGDGSGLAEVLAVYPQ